MAWVTLRFKSLDDNAARLLAQIPGFRYKRGWASCSDHALPIVRDVAASLGLVIVGESAKPSAPLIRRIPLLREWVPKFMTSYQKAGVAHTMTAWHASNESGMFVWATGCLAGDTRITINRGGAAKEITLATLFHKFNGGHDHGRRWDLTIPTMSQSAVDGFVRLNEVTAVVYSGRKETFGVTTAGGRVIRATKDHRFLRPDGSFSPLSDLRAGSEIIAVDWPTARDEASEKAQYDQVDYMWNHPFHVYTVSGRSNRPGALRQARVATHRLTAEARENGLTLAEFVGRVILGQIEGLMFLDPDAFTVHHRNGDHRDNRPDNLEVMKRGDHYSHHAREGGWKHVAGFTVTDRIVSIRSVGEEDTFDVSMKAPHHNFVANDLVVHNSGKTLGSQAWACAAGEDHRTVVMTKSAVRYQWRDQAERYTEASAVVLDGQKPGALPSSGFVVIGYNVLPFWAAELAKWQPHSAIYDESHRVKNPKRWEATLAADGDDVAFDLTKNHAAAAFIVSRAVRRRLATTATPIRDLVRDLWAQVDLVRPGEFGPYRGPMNERAGFVWRYCGARDGQFGGIDDRRNSNLPELKTRLAAVAHYVPFSVANRELPPKRRLVSLVRVAEQNRAAAVAQDIKRAAQSGQRAAIIEARLWEAASRKRKRIVELVEQAIEGKQKVVIFTGRRRDADDLFESLSGKCDRVWVGHGGHADSARREMQKAYMQCEGPAILIGTSEAWGEGLDLQDTDLLLVAMLPYTPGQVIQIEGRVSRLGQKRPVEVVYLIAESSIDEHVAQILLRKLPAVEKATDVEEARGLANELAGGNDEQLIAEIAAMIGG